MSENSLLRRRGRQARLVLADDYELIRSGLRSMLNGQRGLEVVGEAADGQEALDLCRRLQPDLVLIDVRMPKQDGLATCRAIKQECPTTGVILMTIYENPEYFLEALKAGAAGYLLKDISLRELISAIHSVLRGELMLNKDTVVRLLGSLESQTSSQAQSLPNPLSSRECEVLRLLTKGQTNREIAENLTVSVNTVKIHVAHILAKLEVSDRTQAAVRAIELGLLEKAASE